MTFYKVPHLNRWDVDKFWNNGNFLYKPETGCLEWQGYRHPHTDYGKVQVNGVHIPVHRLAYYIYYMEDPGELLVRHLCHNRRCCQPLHLTLGTHWDNSQDMVQAGRSQKGERHWTKRNPELFERLRSEGRMGSRQASLTNGPDHPCTVLTAELVQEIKALSAQGLGNRELAEIFGVTHSNISAIVLGKSWTQVEGPERPKDTRFVSKLTEKQVREIRRRYKDGESKASLARAFKIGETSVFKITHYLSWKHVTDEP